MKGQVTIEYILILVIMLVILATVSMPTVEQIEADVTDVGNAVNLAAAQQRIITTANEMAFTGCGSHKAITLYVQEDLFTPARLEWDGSARTLTGYVTMMNGTEIKLKTFTYANNIHLLDESIGGGYWRISVDKNCTGTGADGCIGMECP